MKTGIELIAEERQRQIEKEGWSAEHDEQHTKGELALVAALYATPVQLYKKQSLSTEFGEVSFIDPWPWFDRVENTRYGDFSTYEVKAWDKRKKHSKLKKLIIAGALIAAEIDRIQRKQE